MDDTLGRQHIPWLLRLLCSCVCFCHLPAAGAAQTTRTGANLVREAVRHAIELAQPDANVDGLQMSERDDLDVAWCLV